LYVVKSTKPYSEGKEGLDFGSVRREGNPPIKPITGGWAVIAAHRERQFLEEEIK